MESAARWPEAKRPAIGQTKRRGLSAFTGVILKICTTHKHHHSILPVGDILSAGGLPVCSRIFFLSHFSDFSLYSQNILIQPLLTTSEFPLKFWKNPHLSSNSHFSDILFFFHLVFPANTLWITFKIWA